MSITKFFFQQVASGEVLHDGKGLAQPWLTLGLPWEIAHG
jgi:hypothetical protein